MLPNAFTLFLKWVLWSEAILWLGIMPINMISWILDGNNIGGTVGKNSEPICKYIPNLEGKSLLTMEGFDIVSLLPINLIFPMNDAVLKVQCHSLFLHKLGLATLTRSPLLSSAEVHKWMHVYLSSCCYGHAIHGLIAQSLLWPRREARGCL